MRTSVLITSIIFIFLSNVSLAEEKIDFWNEQRKGANYFNVLPEEQWFKDASELGIEWVRITYDKWEGEKRDFLMGDAGNYQGLIKEDLDKLIQVLNWSQKYGIKAVITPLGLPGNRWVQKNSGKKDLRLWNNKKYWQQSALFWQDLAKQLKDHPAVYAYNIINEPAPETDTGIAEHGNTSRFISWYQKYQGTSRDLPKFYRLVIKSIRESDLNTPIMLDSGWYAQPNAFIYWPKLRDDKILYSFHMYEPYDFTSRLNFSKKRNLKYPGKIPFAGQLVEWNASQIRKYLAPYFEWAKKNGIALNRLVAGEFGCYRRNKGCEKYLQDVISILNEEKAHWAFYAFREDEWDGYDYELGTGGLGWDYWKLKEAGKNPQPPRRSNSLFSVIEREFDKE